MNDAPPECMDGFALDIASYNSGSVRSAIDEGIAYFGFYSTVSWHYYRFTFLHNVTLFFVNL
jgi:hypothetical protein